ncbi:TfoX/Sxy family protein [Kitasatospora sp. NPDC059571]|uniref:TfoX/Sxy family protein n=1 Tax=Kitasatospora sp. NPDC059571 TaxID=3346871 RepID=UPI0036A02A3D
MAFDEHLARRIHAYIGEELAVTEKRMFGGLVFLFNGNMAVGVRGEELIVRLAPDEAEALLAEPGVRPFDPAGRRMRGWILVGPAALAEDAGLQEWVDRGFEFAAALPPK